MEPQARDSTKDLSVEASPLDSPINGRYVSILLLEGAIIALLWFLGRLY
jgi:hypothetical protein